jgi:pimeloyl-ACP methyl ester carboxylesterase
MSDFFRAHKAFGTPIPTYFIESTAPDNVDDTAVVKSTALPNLTPIDSDLAVREIAAALAHGANPNLVVMVHGFNNPEPAVLRTYRAAAEAIAADSELAGRNGLVCIGYRWPSEKMGQPWRGTWDALPTLPTWILYTGAAFAILPFLLFYLAFDSRQQPSDISLAIALLLTMAGLTFAGLVLTAALLRIIVYFRDTYRATNYGVPDLVQIIRAIDGEIVRLRGAGGATNDVQLSFIGHSMGGFVVTNTIRILSDVFETQVRALNSYGAGSSADNKPESPPPSIGSVFILKRFVLVSPDIPAETLLSSRGNFLGSALSRFDEAYLFSNEGDEVLRQISTLANYFVFPTKNRRHGFRLGNVEILSSDFGLIGVKEDDFLRVLRIGNLTLHDLYRVLEQAKARRHADKRPVPAHASLPKVFTYFDCTDYVDQDTEGKPAQPLLTFAKCLKSKDAKAELPWHSHLHLLFSYVVRQKPNVHGGYFEGALSQQLIYRLACLGYEDTVAAYGGEGALSQVCKDRQIRGLLSPQLAANRSLRSKTADPVSPAAVPDAESSAPPTV